MTFNLFENCMSVYIHGLSNREVKHTAVKYKVRGGGLSILN